MDTAAKHSWLWLLLSAAALCAAAACTDVELSTIPDPPPPPIDNLLSVSGSFCSKDPLSVEFPVKIMFIVDTSGSMAITDPPNPADSNYTGRTRAVIDVINALAGVPGVEIAMVVFHSSANDQTGGFKPNFTAADVAFLTQQAANLAGNNGQTNFEAALETARQVISDDINDADDLVRARSKYIVIFLTDGFPNPIDPPDNTPESILSLVEDIQDLERERRLVELKVHTTFLSGTTPPQFQQMPITLLRDMADTGKGTFRNFGNGEKINFLDIGFTSFRRVFSLKSFIAANQNALPEVDLFTMTDSDGDGLSDQQEDRLGTDPTKPDTDGDGFNDLLERRLGTSGFDALDSADADCQTRPGDDYNRRDDDGDLLLNCEERFLGTNQRLFDSDSDGLPDLFETRSLLSAVDDDYFGDLDRDAVANGFELRDRTNPRVDDSADFATLRYRYDLKEVEIRESRICYEFRVDNIRLVYSLARPMEETGWNNIYIVFGEAPGDDPQDFGEFNIACARARFDLSLNAKSPASGFLELPPDAFHPAANLSDPTDPTIFDPARDCVSP